MLAPGTLLQNRYRIGRRIGQGGMGAVYQAQHEELGHTVAIKETFHAQEETLRKAFKREARLLASLEHPALPKVTDYFMEEERLFLVMQYVSGDDLATLLTQRGAPFPVSEVMTWAFQLLDVIDYLHSQTPPILHRDIKPGNLKLTANGRLMLLDFGLAKGATIGDASTLSSRSVLGYTLSYSPLEQILRADSSLAEHLSVIDAEKVSQVQNGGIDERSDIYSLGATLYHLVTAQMPVQAPTRALAIWSGRSDPLRPAHSLNSDICVEVSTALAKAAALESLYRPATAATLRAWLSEANRAQETYHLTRTLTPSLAPTVPVRQEHNQETTTNPQMQRGFFSPTTDPMKDFTQQASTGIDPRSHPPQAGVLLPASVPAGGKSGRPVMIAILVGIAVIGLGIFSILIIKISREGGIDLAWLGSSSVNTNRQPALASTNSAASPGSNANRASPNGKGIDSILPSGSTTVEKPSEKKGANANSSVETPRDPAKIPSAGSEKGSDAPELKPIPADSTLKKVTGLLDLSGTLKFDRLIAIESTPPIKVGEYTSFRRGNIFTVVIRKAILQGKSSLPGGGAMNSMELQQHGNDVHFVVNMKEGVKTWVWRNNSLLVQVGNNR